MNKIEGFKYQVALKVLLNKYKENAEQEFATIFFNSTTNTVIGLIYSLEDSSQENFNRIDNWIREGSA